MLPELDRKDRYTAILTVDEHELRKPRVSFEFRDPYFVTEVFFYLDDEDTSVMDNIFVEDEGFYELPSDEQEKIWNTSSKPIDIEAFRELLKRYRAYLADEPSGTFQVRTPPSQHSARIDEALELIERYSGHAFKLTFCYVGGITASRFC